MLLRLLGFLAFARLGHRLGEAAGAGRGLLGRRAAAGGEEFDGGVGAHHVGVAPELGEGLVEEVFVLVAVDHGGAQAGAHLVAAADVDVFQRVGGGEHVGRPNRQTGATQQAREVQHIEGERAGHAGRVSAVKRCAATKGHPSVIFMGGLLAAKTGSARARLAGASRSASASKAGRSGDFKGKRMVPTPGIEPGTY